MPTRTLAASQIRLLASPKRILLAFDSWRFERLTTVLMKVVHSRPRRLVVIVVQRLLDVVQNARQGVLGLTARIESVHFETQPVDRRHRRGAARRRGHERNAERALETSVRGNDGLIARWIARRVDSNHGSRPRVRVVVGNENVPALLDCDSRGIDEELPR